MQYFFSFVPCALKINGEYKGIISTEPQGESLKENDFIELLSPNSQFLSLSFLLKSPPPQVRRLISTFGDFIYPLSFPAIPYPMQELYSYSTDGIHLKIICDGFCKLIFSSPTFYTTQILPSKPSNFSVLFIKNGYIGILLELNRQSIYLFNMKNGKLELYYQADKITFQEGVIKAESHLPTLLNHTVKTRFSSSGKNVEIIRGKQIGNLNSLQLKYAFLECVCIKDEVSDFLNPEINSKLFLEFIGQFDCIMPSLSPSHDFSLVGNELRFIKFEIKDDKIANAIID